MNKTAKAHIALLTANIIYAASFPIAKTAMEYVGDSSFVMFRVIGAVMLFWLSASLFVREKTEKKDFPRLMLLAIFGVALNQSLFLKGLHLTSPINAAIMMVTSPILVLIIASIIIKDKITMRKLAGILIGFSGAVFLAWSNLSGNNKESSFLGDLFVFINALSWGLYLVLVKPLMQKYHTVTILKWTFLFGLPLVMPAGIMDLDNTHWAEVPAHIYWYMAAVVVLTTFVAYLLNTYALKELSASVVSAYIYLQPVLTAIIAILIFQNDTLTWEKAGSALMIFAGVYLVSSRSVGSRQ